METDQALKDYVRIKIYGRISQRTGNQKGIYTTLSKQIGRSGTYISNIKNGNNIPSLDLVFRISTLLSIDYLELISGAEDYYYFFDYYSEMFRKRTVKHKSQCLSVFNGSSSRQEFLENILTDYFRGGSLRQNLIYLFEDSNLIYKEEIKSIGEYSNEDIVDILRADYFERMHSLFKESDWFTAFSQNTMRVHEHIKSQDTKLVKIVGPIDIQSMYGHQTNMVDFGINYFVSPGLYYFDNDKVRYLRNSDEAQKSGQIAGKVKSIFVEFD
jgi:transcriptional regulator with XRE-family HTH domain